jgi:hypothetical protein
VVAVIAMTLPIASPSASAEARARSTATPCPAPGTLVEAAQSTAPLRYTEEELRAILDTFKTHDVPGIEGTGLGRDRVEIWLKPGSEAEANRLIEAYGDKIGVQIAHVDYFPPGCGPGYLPKPCDKLVGNAPSTADLVLQLVPDTKTLRASDSGSAHLVVRYIGTGRFAMDTGSALIGVLVAPGTNRSVGFFSFPLAGTGHGPNLGQGESATIGVVFGAARCPGAPGSGSALGVGCYGLRVVLHSESPSDPRKYLSPETSVRVTK